MHDQANEIPAVPDSSRNRGKLIWRWIYLGLACLAVCVMVLMVAVILDPMWLDFLALLGMGQ